MKFYIVYKNALETKDNHIAIPFDYNKDRKDYYAWLINLTQKELNRIEKYYYESINFHDWFLHNDFEIEFWNFLKTKNTFIKTGSYDSKEYGINCFELSSEDLMYMKLMDWIK